MLGSSDTLRFWRLEARGLLFSSARLGLFFMMKRQKGKEGCED
jgi:hypothetical protein